MVKLPSSLYAPGIMGPFGYIPTLECYHGVVSIHHKTNGTIDFTLSDGSLHSSINAKGSGYIEKDHGTI
jgi:tocopherol cyclase